MQGYSISCLIFLAGYAIDTTDPFYEAEQAFMDENCPLYEEKLDAFYRALYHSPFRPELEKQLGSLLFENIGISLKTFSPKNIALSQEESALVTEYAKLLASAQIPFQGETLNLSQLRKYEESLDRAVRKEAYQKEAAFFKEHEASFDRIFDRLVAVRTQMAQNLGYKNFVELGYYRMGRNGYDANMVAHGSETEGQAGRAQRPGRFDVVRRHLLLPPGQSQAGRGGRRAAGAGAQNVPRHGGANRRVHRLHDRQPVL